MPTSRRALLKSALRAVSLPLWTSGLRAATLVRSPYLQNVRTDRCTLMWTTREAGTPEVQYATDATFSRPARASGTSREFTPQQTGLRDRFFQHQVELRNLSADTQYFYRILIDGQNLTPPAPGGGQRFRTAPETGSFRFVALGDSGQGTGGQLSVFLQMQRDNPALVVHVGDIAYPSGTFETYQLNYFDIYAEMMAQAPFFPSPGNHDVDLDAGAAYRAVHAVPAEGVPPPERGNFYSFDWGTVHFVSLDSNYLQVPARLQTQLDWLTRDLQSTRKPWRIAYWHHAPYEPLRANEDGSRISRERIVPILEQYGVQLVLAGHQHSYARTKPLLRGAPADADQGIIYVTTGGGGGFLYPVEQSPLYAVPPQSEYHHIRVDVQSSRMTVKGIRSDGRELDSGVTLEPLPSVLPGGAVNAASFMPSLAPGGLITIFGRNLAFEERKATILPLPTELGGVRVSLNDRDLPLVFVSAGQINAQLPFDIVGDGVLRISTPNGSSSVAVTLIEAAPGIFIVGGSTPTAAILRADYSLVSASDPVTPGEYISIFLTGMGLVRPEIPAGHLVPPTPLYSVMAPVQVQIGGVQVFPSFAGLAPGAVGLYQVNLQVPDDLEPGEWTLRVVERSVRSNAVLLSVR